MMLNLALNLFSLITAILQWWPSFQSLSSPVYFGILLEKGEMDGFNLRGEGAGGKWRKGEPWDEARGYV